MKSLITTSLCAASLSHADTGMMDRTPHVWTDVELLFDDSTPVLFDSGDTIIACTQRTRVLP